MAGIAHSWILLLPVAPINHRFGTVSIDHYCASDFSRRNINIYLKQWSKTIRTSIYKRANRDDMFQSRPSPGSRGFKLWGLSKKIITNLSAVEFSPMFCFCHFSCFRKGAFNEVIGKKSILDTIWFHESVCRQAYASFPANQSSFIRLGSWIAYVDKRLH